MKLTYEKNGDYLIPNLTANEEPEGTLTKYGMMRKNFLQEHRKGIYQGMILAGELKAHCLEIQEQAEQRMEALSEQMAKAEGVNEELKAADQMKWVQQIQTLGFLEKSKLLRNPNFSGNNAQIKAFLLKKFGFLFCTNGLGRRNLLRFHHCFSISWEWIFAIHFPV